MASKVVLTVGFLITVFCTCVPEARSHLLGRKLSNTPTTPTTLELPLQRVLNEETRKSLVYVMLDKMNDTYQAFETILPAVMSCKQKLAKRSSGCLRCVTDRCMDRRYYCESRGMSWFSMSPPVRSSSVGSDVTACSIMRGSRTCTLIMTPSNALSRSVSVMADKLMGKIDPASKDLTKDVVISLAHGIQRLVNNTNVEPSVRWRTDRKMQDLIYDLRSNRRDTRTHWTDPFNTNGENQMNKEKEGNNPQSSEFSKSMSDQFGGLFGELFRRRRKRQAPYNHATIQPEPEVPCSVIENDRSQCRTYSKACTSCNDVTEGLIPKACGAAVSDMVGAVDNKLQKLSILFDDILAARDFIDKVEIDYTSIDPKTLSLKDHNVTVSVGYEGFTFKSTTPLNLFRLTQTTDGLAGEIWSQWVSMKY